MSKMSFRGAFTPFLHISAGEFPRQYKKLAQHLLNTFNEQYGQEFEKGSPNHLTKILEKYSSHGWLHVGTYNNLLEGIGKKFNEFTPY